MYPRTWSLGVEGFTQKIYLDQPEQIPHYQYIPNLADNILSKFNNFHLKATVTSRWRDHETEV